MGEKWNVYKFLVGKPEGNRPLDVNGRIMLKWILETQDGMGWYGLDSSG
jgi:hypothetical protein